MAIEEQLTPFGFIDNGIDNYSGLPDDPYTGEELDELFLEFFRDNF